MVLQADPAGVPRAWQSRRPLCLGKRLALRRTGLPDTPTLGGSALSAGSVVLREGPPPLSGPQQSRPPVRTGCQPAPLPSPVFLGPATTSWLRLSRHDNRPD